MDRAKSNFVARGRHACAKRAEGGRRCYAAVTLSPRFRTRCRPFRALPVGFFWPIFHFCTVETFVSSKRALQV